jgi:hypothetical protein
MVIVLVIFLWAVLCLPPSLSDAAQRAIAGIEKLSPLAAPYTGDCILGNLTTALSYTGWWDGNESYAMLVDPLDGSCACNLGVAIQAVHISLWLEPGTSQLVQSRMLEAVPDGAGCWAPGGDLVTSEWHAISGVTTAGVYDIEIPTYFWCAEVLEPYFVSVDFLGSNAPGLKLVGGGSGNGCTVWNDWGDGWQDLVASMGFLDDLTIWTETGCCSAPISNVPTSWGDLKAAYR